MRPLIARGYMDIGLIDNGILKKYIEEINPKMVVVHRSPPIQMKVALLLLTPCGAF